MPIIKIKVKKCPLCCSNPIEDIYVYCPFCGTELITEIEDSFEFPQEPKKEEKPKKSKVENRTLERDIERYAVKEIKKLGCIVVKFTPAGQVGYADRAIFIPGGRLIFIEFKAPGKKPRPLQLKRARDLAALGFKTYFIDSFELVDSFIRRELTDGL